MVVQHKFEINISYATEHGQSRCTRGQDAAPTAPSNIMSTYIK